MVSEVAPSTINDKTQRLAPARPSLQHRDPTSALDNRGLGFTMSLMPYRKSLFKKENFYHVYSRGDRKEPVFVSDRDYERFLEKTEEYRSKYPVDIIAYCLLPNHFHLLLKQLTEIPLSKFMGVLQSSHSHYASTKYSLPLGHLFQGRFGSRLIESEEDFLNTSRYIHLNPVKEKILALDFTYQQSRRIKDRLIVDALRSYKWSSYGFYLSQKRREIVTINPSHILEIDGTRNKYRRFVESKITDEDALNLESF